MVQRKKFEDSREHSFITFCDVAGKGKGREGGRGREGRVGEEGKGGWDGGRREGGGGALKEVNYIRFAH